MSEDKQFDVNVDLEETKKAIKTSLQEAYDNRKTVKKAPKVTDITDTNIFLIREKDSHLYPFILEDAYKKLGLVNIAKHLSKPALEHEYQHGNASPKNTSVYYGVAFYETGDGPLVQPFNMITIDGEVVQQEMIDYALAPDKPSKIDKELATNQKDEPSFDQSRKTG